jgi:hypothetical protein
MSRAETLVKNLVKARIAENEASPVRLNDHT